MTPHRRPPGAPDPATSPDDDLTALITGALHRRAADAPDPGAVAARLASEVSRRTSPRAVALRRSGHVLAAGVVTGSIAVAAASAAAATNPYSKVAVAVEDAARTVGLDVSFLPAGAATREQYDAVWAAGYDTPDIDALAELWGTDYMETKAQLGQQLLDGVDIPVAPGSVTYVPNIPGEDEFNAFFAGGYTYEDAEALGALWGVEAYEAKTRAGAALIEGEALPLPPSEAPVETPPATAPRPGATDGR